MFVRVEFEGDCECGEMLLVGLVSARDANHGRVVAREP